MPRSGDSLRETDCPLEDNITLEHLQSILQVHMLRVLSPIGRLQHQVESLANTLMGNPGSRLSFPLSLAFRGHDQGRWSEALVERSDRKFEVFIRPRPHVIAQ